MRGSVPCLIAVSLTGLITPLSAQVSFPRPVPSTLVVQPAPLPSTLLEGFQPEAGTVVTLGFEELGMVARSSGTIYLDVRVVRDEKGNSASGVGLLISEGSDRREQLFVDADEIPALVRGLDALLSIAGNPTAFKKFEARYTTKARVAFVAYSIASGAIEFSVQTGRPTLATVVGLDAVEMFKMRVMFDTAHKRLASAG
jgi:hypothetical protein